MSKAHLGLFAVGFFMYPHPTLSFPNWIKDETALLSHKKVNEGEFLHPVLMFPPIACSQIRDLLG
jgi:hypothetical protein